MHMCTSTSIVMLTVNCQKEGSVSFVVGLVDYALEPLGIHALQAFHKIPRCSVARVMQNCPPPMVLQRYACMQLLHHHDAKIDMPVPGSHQQRGLSLGIHAIHREIDWGRHCFMPSCIDYATNSSVHCQVLCNYIPGTNCM